MRKTLEVQTVRLDIDTTGKIKGGEALLREIVWNDDGTMWDQRSGGSRPFVVKNIPSDMLTALDGFIDGLKSRPETTEESET
jgi:hypothetical protein